MVLDSMDDDSDSKESDFLSFGGDDIDVYLNHYRIPKLINCGASSTSNPPKGRENREQVKYNNEGKIMFYCTHVWRTAMLTCLSKPRILLV